MTKTAFMGGSLSFKGDKKKKAKKKKSSKSKHSLEKDERESTSLAAEIVEGEEELTEAEKHIELDVPQVAVRVLAARPSHDWGEMHGLYTRPAGRGRATVTVGAVNDAPVTGQIAPRTTAEDVAIIGIDVSAVRRCCPPT